MKHEPGIFDQINPEADAASIARARAQIAAGRGVPHEEVGKWLRTVGTPDWKPMPREWLE